MMTFEEAVLSLRSDPACSQLILDSYLGSDLSGNAKRFRNSWEFRTVVDLLQGRIQGAVVLDVGSGTGIASHALAACGASQVLALEPDPSRETGWGAIRRLPEPGPSGILAASGEAMPLARETIDIIYARQVLHHAQNLNCFLKECARVLKPGGLFLACREHVVDDQVQRKEFLKNHPIHRLTENENAYPLRAYLKAIKASGLILLKILDPWSSVINTYPEIQDPIDFNKHPRILLERKLGRIGTALSFLPGIRKLVWWRVRRPIPGRRYSFLARKPPSSGASDTPL